MDRWRRMRETEGRKQGVYGAIWLAGQWASCRPTCRDKPASVASCQAGTARKAAQARSRPMFGPDQNIMLWTGPRGLGLQRFIAHYLRACKPSVRPTFYGHPEPKWSCIVQFVCFAQINQEHSLKFLLIPTVAFGGEFWYVWCRTAARLMQGSAWGLVGF